MRASHWRSTCWPGLSSSYSGRAAARWWRAQAIEPATQCRLPMPREPFAKIGTRGGLEPATDPLDGRRERVGVAALEEVLFVEKAQKRPDADRYSGDALVV